MTDAGPPTLTAAMPDEPAVLVDADGIRTECPELDPWVADVTEPLLRRLYADMVLARRIDVEATALQRQGELALWAPILGQEAAQIGSAHALRPDDFVFSSYRETGVAYVRGATPAELLPMFRATAQVGWDPLALRMAPMQIIIGAQTLHALGYALGIQHDGAADVAVTYFGDGATSQGSVNEAMVFAASFQAPVLFFCQNNQYAISEPVRLQSRLRLAQRADGFGIPSIRVDGNDVLAVLAATRMALARARSGGGPTFIEAVTYRMGPHTTSDDPGRYRSPEEVAVWARRDPIERLERLLRDSGQLDDDFAAEVQRDSDRLAADLRAACLALTEPDPSALFSDVYAEPHHALERQRDAHRRFLAMFEGDEP